MIPIQGTNVEERCVKADRWSPSNETSIVRNCDSILAIGYILISPISFLDKPSRKIVQRSYFYSLPLCKEGWGRWSPISLHGRCCILILHPVQKKRAVTYLESSILKLLTWKIYPAMHLELQVLPCIASGHFIANSATKWLFVE